MSGLRKIGVLRKNKMFRLSYVLLEQVSKVKVCDIYSKSVSGIPVLLDNKFYRNALERMEAEITGSDKEKVVLYNAACSAIS
jgi:hypothetical protein